MRISALNSGTGGKFMTRKTYRTAQGKIVDLGSLQLQNENTRAVGNMKVNARGDLIDGWNRPIDRRTQQVQKQYDRQTTNVRDEPVQTSAQTQAPSQAQARPARPAKEAKATKEPVLAEPAAVPNHVESGGLAAAIARARRIRQEPIETPQQRSQTQAGVTKI